MKNNKASSVMTVNGITFSYTYSFSLLARLRDAISNNTTAVIEEKRLFLV